MKKIWFIKNGIVRAGQCKGWNVTVVFEKERDEHDDNFYLYLENPKTKKQSAEYYGNFESLKSAVKEMDIEWIVSEERQKENEVMAWWIEKFPQSKAVFDVDTRYCNSTDAVGIYVLIGSLIINFYDKPLKAHNSNDLKKFLNLYNQFILEFKGKFLEHIYQWLPENSEVQDSIIAMVSTEMGEGTDPKDYNYVLNLMPEGPLKEEFIRFVNWNNDNK